MSGAKVIAAALLVIPLMALGGCTHWFSRHSTGSSPDALYAVAAEKTPFYRYGPQQAQGADRELTRDTLVTIIRRSFGYTKVRLEDGQQGFVANDDLVRAPKKLLAQANASSSGAEGSSLPPTPHVSLPSSDSSPEFEPTPIPQPLMPP